MAQALNWLAGLTLIGVLSNALAHSDVLTAMFSGSALVVCASVYEWILKDDG